MTFLGFSKFLTRGAVGVVGLSAIAVWGVPGAAIASNIQLGSDYLESPAGLSFYNFPGIGQVLFKGKPVGPGKTDTIIQRLEDAVFDDNNDGILERTSDTIPIELTLLSLENVSPINIGGTDYNVLVGLNSNTPSTGTMTINHNTTDLGGGNLGFDDSDQYQGTFTSIFTVNFTADFTPIGGGQGFTVSDSLQLINDGANWSHKPTIPNPVLVRPPTDQNANCHTSSGDCAPTDFFTGQAKHGPDDTHVTRPASVPEPSNTAAIAILGLGSLIVGIKRKGNLIQK